MTYIPENINRTAINTDAGGRIRSSNLSTLFDGKTLDNDNPLLWRNAGTGTFNFVSNQMQMSVTAGQYCIRQNHYKCPYGSGKSQLIEMTADTFGIETGVVKKMGYYSSSTVAPYVANLDGLWLENDGTTIYLKASRNGVETMSIAWTDWDNYDEMSTYDWDNFTVAVFDFLWLGGTELRLFIKTAKGFLLAHCEPWAGTAPGTFMNSPSQYVRYELRSSTGVGSFNSICSHVATEGDLNQVGKSLSVITPTAITTNTIGTIYAVKSVRFNTAAANSAAQMLSATVTNTATTDLGIMLLIVNPTLSAPITYTPNGDAIEEGNPTNQTITADTGRIIGAAPAGDTGALIGLNNNLLSYLGGEIDGVVDEFVLAYIPTTTNQSVFGTMTVKEL